MNKEKAETLLENYQALSELYSNIRKELEHTRKDLEIARKALEDITKVRCGLEDFEPKAVTMTRIAENTLEQISPNRN